jgi:hypothetical protein
MMEDGEWHNCPVWRHCQQFCPAYEIFAQTVAAGDDVFHLEPLGQFELEAEPDFDIAVIVCPK